MRQELMLQDIEELRRQEGIEDVELQHGIRDLKVGDCVKVSLMTGTESFETLRVRITSIRGFAFRGKLAIQNASARLAKRLGGTAFAFTTAHIHSITKRADNP